MICARTPDDLQAMMDILNDIMAAFGQEISVMKTKVMVSMQHRVLST